LVKEWLRDKKLDALITLDEEKQCFGCEKDTAFAIQVNLLK
jgi:hypothetical protein